MKMRCAGALLFALGTTACGGEYTDGETPIGETFRGIFGGSPPNAPMHDAVVSLHQVYSDGTVSASIFCSGTLIAEDVVLTAGHCLDVGSRRKVRARSPSSLAIYVGNEPATDPSPSVFGVAETKIHNAYDKSGNSNDIALVRLAQAVPNATPVASLPASLGFTQADVDANLTLNSAGFGKDESGTTGTKLQVDHPLEGLGCTVAGCPDSGDSATQISYTQSVSGPCNGDSGGPQFVYRNGTAYVGGITSYGDSYCTIYGVSTRADAFEGWIASFVGASSGPDCSADGACNTDCAPGNDPDCSFGGGGCGDGVCDAGESCDGQSGTTACSADCPGRTGGKPSRRYCFVGGTCQGPGCP